MDKEVRREGLFNIVRELMLEDTVAYREMMRMSYNDFSQILSVIESVITPHQVMGGHKVISAAERLTLTIRFLATGETFHSLSFQFRIAVATVSYIVKSVCAAIIQFLGPIHMKVPSTDEEWLEIAQRFQDRWNFPNCVGAIDGKHIVMVPPANSGSHYFNYKQRHSIVLMAVVGPDYECLYADVGTNGRVSDGGVWNKCSLSQSIEDGVISLPPPKRLPSDSVFGLTEEVPHVFVGDDAFALKTHMMKPYSQHGLSADKRIYNYRHSRARRVSENLFGIMANRWRVFHTILMLPPETIEILVMAALILHNYLRRDSLSAPNAYCPTGLIDREDRRGKIIDGNWRQDMQPTESFLPLLVPSKGHNVSNDAKNIRDTFKDYFCHEGAVDWQWGLI